MIRGIALAASLFFSTAACYAQTDDAPATLPEEKVGAATESISLTYKGVSQSLSFSEGDNGEALYQGDIILGPIEKLRQSNALALQDLGSEILFGLAIRNRETRWPDGVVRYRIDKSLPNPGRVRSAIAAWEAATRIRFTEISDSAGNFVEFVSGSGCSSAVGMIVGRQFIRLGETCGIGNTIHEIGHALGLHHEQARDDRNKHILVYDSNIVAEAKGNFDSDPTTYQDMGKYCFNSITHYSRYAFSKKPNVLKTIETIPPGLEIGQRVGLAPCDIETIAKLYGHRADDAVAPVIVGEMELYPDGCKAKGKCYLKNDITFTDPRGVRWRAGKWVEGSPETIETGTTDGASIPSWAQSIVGEPFKDEYLLAAVLHDHYCYKENHVRDWRETHRMFYDAMIALKVPDFKAKLMYAAVYLGGPKWTRLVPGESCGPQCVYDVVAGKSAAIKVGIDRVVLRKDRYGDASFQTDLANIEKRLTEKPNMSLTQIEDLALRIRPDDPFFRAGRRYEVMGANDTLLVQ